MNAELKRALIFIAGFTTATVGLLVLIGWQFDIAILKNLASGTATMKANTALALLLSGLTLTILQKQTPFLKTVVRISGLLIALVGLLSFSEYIIGWNLGIDQFLYRVPANAYGTSNPGRMTPNAALNFALIGIAYLAFTFKSLRNKHIIDFAAIFSLTISTFGLFSYATGLMGFAGIGSPEYTKMAIYAAITFIVLGIGILSAFYESQSKTFAIKQKLFAGLSLVATIIMFVTLLFSSNIKAMHEASRLTTETHEVSQEINMIMADIIDLEIGANDFINNGDKKYLETITAAKEKLPLRLIQIKTLDKSVGYMLSLDTLNQLVKKRIIYTDQLCNIYTTKGQKASIAFVRTGKGKILTDSIRTVVAKMELTADYIVKIKNDAEIKSLENNQLILIVSLILQLILLGLIYVPVSYTHLTLPTNREV